MKKIIFYASFLTTSLWSHNPDNEQLNMSRQLGLSVNNISVTTMQSYVDEEDSPRSPTFLREGSFWDVSPAPYEHSTSEGDQEITTDQIMRILDRNPQLKSPLLAILKQHSSSDDELNPLGMTVRETGGVGRRNSFERRVESVVLGSLSVPRSLPPERLTIRILSIDGGGVRGIIPAYFLMKLEERFRMPIQSMFHFVAGTSAGGILATALSLPSLDDPTKPRFTSADLMSILFKETPHIFSKKWFSFGGLMGPKYKSPLKVFQRLVGEKTPFSGGVIKTMVTTYDLEANKLKLLTNFPNTECREENREPEVFTAADTMSATSAAPTFFPPHMCKPQSRAIVDRYVLGDGGIGANNPSRLILQEVLSQYPGAEIIMVSLGTGYKANSMSYHKVKNAGILKWLKVGLIDMLMGAPNAIGVHEVEALFNPLCAPKTTTSMKSMIEGMYFRFDPSVADDRMDNTSESNLRALMQNMRSDIEKPGSMWHQLVKTLEERPLTPSSLKT